MDLGAFTDRSPGRLVRIDGHDPRIGPWQHMAFVPNPLPEAMVELSPATWLAVANARAALGSLDAAASRLPDPALLRRPTLRREAQSTSALEGTYAPLDAVLAADSNAPATPDLREILNYVNMADHAFESLAIGRELSASLLCELQELLVRATPLEGRDSGTIRTTQVVIGMRHDAQPGDPPVKAARFVPAPPEPDLRPAVQELMFWLRADHSSTIDPVVVAAMAHYQFETLHPFHDGNGRVGRLLMVMSLLETGTLGEPTLTVSPWFERRRPEYYDALLAVSTAGAWDAWIRFFADGLRHSASSTLRSLNALVDVQTRLKEVVRASPLRADTAHLVVDYALAHPSFSVRDVERDMELSYGRANGVVGQLVDLGVLAAWGGSYNRRFHAPEVVAVLRAD